MALVCVAYLSITKPSYPQSFGAPPTFSKHFPSWLALKPKVQGGTHAFDLYLSALLSRSGLYVALLGMSRDGPRNCKDNTDVLLTAPNCSFPKLEISPCRNVQARGTWTISDFSESCHFLAKGKAKPFLTYKGYSGTDVPCCDSARLPGFPGRVLLRSQPY
jgi:hypothetical protein